MHGLRTLSPTFSPLPVPEAATGPVRAARESELMSEFIGARITVERSPGWQALPWEGVIVDETKNTFHVVPLSGGHARVLPKAGLEGAVAARGQAIRFKGDELRHRPEDRVKRLAPRGRSRRP